MLLKSYTKEISRHKCNSGFESVYCIARLDRDINAVIPYLNAALGVFEAKRCDTCGELTFVNKLRVKGDGSLVCIPCSGYEE